MLCDLEQVTSPLCASVPSDEDTRMNALSLVQGLEQGRISGLAIITIIIVIP